MELSGSDRVIFLFGLGCLFFFYLLVGGIGFREFRGCRVLRLWEDGYSRLGSKCSGVEFLDMLGFIYFSSLGY